MCGSPSTWVLMLLSIFIFSLAERIKYVVTERPAVTYVDKINVLWANSSSRRYGRNDPVYYYDLIFESASTWSNNVSVDFYFFQWLTNQYKRSFVEMHFLLCDLLQTDKFFGTGLRQGNLNRSCPLPPGVYYTYNSSIPTTAIPKGFPFTKGRIYANVTGTKTKEIFAAGHIDMEIKERTIRKKKPKKNYSST